MRLRGDYPYEMRKLREISDRDIERLLSGEALGDADLDEVASHLRNLRAASARIPGEEVASRHVAAMVDAARKPAYGAAPAGAAPFAPIVRQRRSLVYRTRVFVARVATGAVALSGATAGLAYAGVDLPGQAAEKAFEQVLGVELPNQDEGSENAPESAGAVADRVHAVIDAWEADKGCAFGQAVATAARGDDSTAGPSEDPCAEETEGEEEEAATAGGSKATGEEKSSAGKATAEEKSSAGKATAEEKSSAGKATAEEKSSAGKATAEESSGSGQSTAEESSETGKATGEEKSSEGQSNKPEETGKP